MYYIFIGTNFLGKFHNTKQHIQFIEWILEKKELPLSISKKFFTHVNQTFPGKRDNIDFQIKRKNIRDNFDSCDCFIFELCSIKKYELDSCQVQDELCKKYKISIQSEQEIYNDLLYLLTLLPSNKKIIFQCHFRPNIIYNDNSKAIKNREMIYNILKKLCDNNDQLVLHDPSNIIKNDHSIYDGHNHWNNKGHEKNFNKILESV
tara:strand:+ start:180 stop:794 length:615 start_codon:yes stop_codon:yes gene_type:complete